MVAGALGNARTIRSAAAALSIGAGRLARISGRHVLRLSNNPATKDLYHGVEHALVA
jgi:hypothetical protein